MEDLRKDLDLDLDLASELLFDLTLDVHRDSQRVGDIPDGRRQIFAITGGRFQGPRLRGTVLPGGGDWLRIRADSVGELDVRITLRTDDDALIYMHYGGLLHFPEAARVKMRAGQTIGPSEYYLRSTPVFETGAEPYAWLNRTLAVGVGRRTRDGVAYRVHAIL